MYTLLIRDEQGNMRVLHDWHRGHEPSLMGHDDCQGMAQKIRQAYPNATHGLEFCYYYTGDDWSGMTNTKMTDAFVDLPKFGKFLYSDKPSEPDMPEIRSPLPRTAPCARLREEVEKSVKKTMESSEPLLNCSCGWSGNLADAAEYDAEYPYCIDWTCPDCNHENTHASGGSLNLPINAES